ncbi:MAG: hypothetical protein KDG89_18530 [Geminicoccaceae bacterium]|nr:hypothetical protein [Geminicoccaceae bacterium]
MRFPALALLCLAALALSACSGLGLPDGKAAMRDEPADAVPTETAPPPMTNEEVGAPAGEEDGARPLVEEPAG